MSNDNEATVNAEDLKDSFSGSSRKGRAAGLDHLKEMDIDKAIIEYSCFNMLMDHPWIKDLKLVSNPYMYASFGRANYKTHTVELSIKCLSSSPEIQRQVFVRTLCHFIAKRFFGETGEGQGYKFLVQRYIKKQKGQSNSTGTIHAPDTAPQHETEAA